MAFKEEALRNADMRVRRVNTILRQAASTFGIGSTQYEERAEMLRAITGLDNTLLSYDQKTGALQLRRSRAALTKATERSSASVLLRMEAMKSVEAIKGRMLEMYEKRTGKNPAEVDKSIKGRQARAQARRAQIDAALKSQAVYHKQLQDRIEDAVKALYELEARLGYETKVHDLLHSQHPFYATTEEKEKLLAEMEAELSSKKHEISTAYEAGLAGNILGVGGLTDD